MIVKVFKVYWAIILWLPMLAWSNPSPCTSNLCKKKLEEYLNRMEAINTPKEGQVYHVKYQLKTTFNQRLGIDSEITDTEVFTSFKKIALYDRKMKIFGDDENIFVVLPENQKIYWNNSDPRIFNDTNTYKRFLEVQRTLLKSATSISCSEPKNGRAVITVIPSLNFTGQTKLQQQRVTYDLMGDRILKVENIYNDESKIRNQTITYNKIDFNSTKKIIGPIAALFQGKELKQAYKGFEIIDNRK